MNKFFSSESVTKGHPDKVADLIADNILDAALKGDKKSRVACEVAVTSGYALVFGEITSSADLNIEKIVRDSVKSSGYDNDLYGYNGDNIQIDIRIDQQSPDIALGVDNLNQGAGDQGIIFGFATDETPEYMPLAISLANKLAYRLTEVREKGIIKGLRPDGKTQVTIEYDQFLNPVRVDTIVLSTQHDDDKNYDELKKEIIELIIKEVIPSSLLDNLTKYYINPTGRFVIGGPVGDSGLTGRKLIVDTYGGYAKHGGGALSGKDATKVDRSASYMARYIAKNIVASKVAKKCEIQISYAIGVAKPVSIFVETFRTAVCDEELIQKAILDNFDLTPKGIIKELDLTNPIFSKTANYGHFGRSDYQFTWEKTDKVAIFKKLL